MIMRTQRLQEPGYHEYRMANCARRYAEDGGGAAC